MIVLLVRVVFLPFIVGLYWLVSLWCGDGDCRTAVSPAAPGSARPLQRPWVSVDRVRRPPRNRVFALAYAGFRFYKILS